MSLDLRASVDLSDALDGLEALASRRAVAKGLRALKKPVRLDQRDHARKTEGPEGRWPARKLRSRRRLLGRLPSAVKVSVSGNAVSAVSSSRWSAIHQEGGIAGYGAQIPSRPFLWVSDGLATKAADVLRDVVLEGW